MQIEFKPLADYSWSNWSDQNEEREEEKKRKVGRSKEEGSEEAALSRN